jgi:hypothetical protein
MMDKHEQKAVDALRNVAGSLANVTVAVGLLLTGIKEVPTWVLIYVAGGFTLLSLGQMIWHLARSDTALKLQKPE